MNTDINDLHPTDDVSNNFFIWHEWLQANGALTIENVFDYFSYSQFYDKQSNNQVLRMQTMHTGMPIENEAEELRRFTGIEFALTHADPPTFFIIQKRQRLSPDEVKPIAVYFIMNSQIYQAPDVYTLLSNRLYTSVSALQNSLDILRKNRPDYTPRTGFVWPIVGDPAQGAEGSKKKLPPPEEAAEDGAKAPETDPSGSKGSVAEGSSSGGASRTIVPTPNFDKRVNTMLLLNAMRSTHMNSKIVPPTPDPSTAESVTAETPSTSQVRSSVTPAPSVQDATAKGLQGESSKASAKKKRKRSVVIATSGS